jgi:hypothetical protein
MGNTVLLVVIVVIGLGLVLFSGPLARTEIRQRPNRSYTFVRVSFAACGVLLALAETLFYFRQDTAGSSVIALLSLLAIMAFTRRKW